MAIYNSIKEFHPIINEKFLEKAEQLRPKLIESTIFTVPSNSKPMKKGDKLLLDFGDHHVGTLSFHAESVGSPMDAPAKLRVRFVERLFELEEDWDNYNGDVSSSWLQEEIFFLDVLPIDWTINRRHAFRYVEILVIDTTPKYQIVLSNISCKSISSADYQRVENLSINDAELTLIDKISLRTAHQCTQLVFEDGPKRDQRLWLGDLRLQALSNYATFKNYDLVKRCLYLFAGMTNGDGQVGACLFHLPVVQVDDTALFDYSLAFVSTLLEYYEETKDLEALNDLYDTAKKQVDLALEQLDERGIVKDHDSWWCFVDWGEGLNKQASAEAILIATLRDLCKLTKYLNKETSCYEECITRLSDASMTYLFDKEKGLFVSGDKKQISWASQIWFVLAGILTNEENKALLERITKEKSAVKLVTPYAHHYYVMALLESGLKEKAIDDLKNYWGRMVKEGADTFYEVYDPENPESSPYGGRIINSYCHAWSGTPCYIIRKFLLK